LEEYQATGKYDVNAIIENLDDNGCLEEFKKQIVHNTLAALFSCSFNVAGQITVTRKDIDRVYSEFEMC
jgi:hypothetical protein